MRQGDWVSYRATVGRILQSASTPRLWWVRLLSGSETVLDEDNATVLVEAPAVRFTIGGSVRQGALGEWDPDVRLWTVESPGQIPILVPPTCIEIVGSVTVCPLPGCGKPIDVGALACWMCGNPV